MGLIHLFDNESKYLGVDKLPLFQKFSQNYLNATP